MNEMPLTIEERDRALDYIADRLHRYRLETPAILFLELNRPFTGIAGLAAHTVTPLFGAFTGLDTAERYAALLGDKDALDALINRLDETRSQPNTPSSESDPEPRNSQLGTQ